MSRKETCHRTFVKLSIEFLYEKNKEQLKTMSVFGCGSKKRKLKNGDVKIIPSRAPMSPQKVEAIIFFIKTRCQQNSEHYDDRQANQYLTNALQVIQRRVNNN